MTRRYYVPDLPGQGGHVSLPDAEAQHAVRVMRLQAGDEIELFDGRGNQSLAVVRMIRRNQCECEAEVSRQVSREPSRIIDLGLALPKPDRARELLERLTELGVRSVTPLVAQRSQRPPSDSLLEKLNRTVVEACKQSGRNHLLEIREAMGAGEFFASARECIGLIAHPHADSMGVGSVSREGAIMAAVGPEGGWTDDEFELARRHGFLPLQLGRRIYRIETAAVVIAAALGVD
jgi:16S rRNA (uracil1498-N3)-methyltransferase